VNQQVEDGMVERKLDMTEEIRQSCVINILLMARLTVREFTCKIVTTALNVQLILLFTFYFFNLSLVGGFEAKAMDDMPIQGAAACIFCPQATAYGFAFAHGIASLIEIWKAAFWAPHTTQAAHQLSCSRHKNAFCANYISRERASF